MGLTIWLWSFEPLMVYKNLAPNYMIEISQPISEHNIIFLFTSQLRQTKYIPILDANQLFILENNDIISYVPRSIFKSLSLVQ